MKRRNNGSIFKRLLGNKNTVTILGVLACIVTLIIGYNYRVNNAISPITVPYAKESIPSRTLITSDMVGRIKLASNYVTDSSNLIKNVNEVVNNYVSYKTNIPKGSLFYKESIKTSDEMPDAAFANIGNGFTIYSLGVTVDSTFANSIRAGDYIDLYMSATSPTDNLVIYAKMIESIRVLAVKDSRGNNILKSTVANGKPSELLFAVPDELYLLLMRAEAITNTKITIEPVLRNQAYTEAAGETKVSSEQLRNFINDQVTILQ